MVCPDLRVHIIGGGPAGLSVATGLVAQPQRYFVTLWERNSELQPVGGVVLREEQLREPLLGALRDAASLGEVGSWCTLRISRPSHSATVPTGRFFGVPRAWLIGFLTRELSKHMNVLRENRAPTEADLTGEDLVVHAEGASCAFRDEHACDFGTVHSRSRMVHRWLWGTGANSELEIRLHDNGAWSHLYPMGRGRVVAIVEALSPCSESEASRMLSDAGLVDLSAGTNWRHFRTIQNRASLVRGRHVLVGDAAHAAHFSVGAGTALALEDARSLVACLGIAPSVEVGLRRYSSERLRAARSTARGAARSTTWLEEAAVSSERGDHEFVLGAATRTHRVTVGDVGSVVDQQAFRTPFSVGTVTLRNRVVVSPMCQYRARDGAPALWHRHHWSNLARGGAGLVMTGMVCVEPRGRITRGCLGLYHDGLLSSWEQALGPVRRNTDTLFGIQLGHSGLRGGDERPWCVLGSVPGPLPAHEGDGVVNGSGGRKGKGTRLWPCLNPNLMDNQDRHDVRRAFVRATQRAARLGADVLELHMAHGYLLSAHITPLTNRRTDEYGGSLRNRMRFPLEVLDEVRNQWEGPLFVRISALDGYPGGHGVAEAVEVAAHLKAHGADLIDVSAGQTHSDARPEYGRCFLAPVSERIRREVGIPTMVVGQVFNVDDVSTLVATGRADLAALARAHLRDPFITYRASHSPRSPAAADQLRG